MKIFKKRFWKTKSIFEPSNEKNIEFILIKSKDNSLFTNLEVKKGWEMIPQWYKDMESITKIKGYNDLTIKKCIPVLDALTTGYFLVTTQDYYFKADLKKEEYSFSAGELRDGVGHSLITSHPVEQIQQMPIGPEFIKYPFKWTNPYLIKTPKNYSIVFTHPLNSPHLPFYTLSGQVDTDLYPLTVQFPFLMKNNFEGKIPAGTPIIQIIPIKRDSWKSNIYKNPTEDFVRYQQNETNRYMENTFKDGERPGGTYKKFFRIKKTYL